MLLLWKSLLLLWKSLRVHQEVPDSVGEFGMLPTEHLQQWTRNEVVQTHLKLVEMEVEFLHLFFDENSNVEKIKAESLDADSVVWNHFHDEHYEKLNGLVDDDVSTLRSLRYIILNQPQHSIGDWNQLLTVEQFEFGEDLLNTQENLHHFVKHVGLVGVLRVIIQEILKVS